MHRLPQLQNDWYEQSRQPKAPTTGCLLSDKWWLFERYWIDGMSTTEIAAIVNMSHKTVSRWLYKHNIPTRDNSMAQMTPSRQKKRAELVGYLTNVQKTTQPTKDWNLMERGDRR